MRTVPIRKLQRRAYEELKDVPFIVTRQNKKTRVDQPSFIVAPYSPEAVALLEKEPEQEEKQTGIFTRLFGKK